MNKPKKGVEHSVDSPGLPPDFDTKIDDTPGDTRQHVEGEAVTAPLPDIPGYRVDRKLGQGGMGSVFLATDNSLNRQVAIKLVAQSYHDADDLIQRFESEVQVLAALQHPHIARLYSSGTIQGVPYFVMEYVEGPTLDELARDPMEPREAIRIIIDLCEAVDYCHDRETLHRDLKPSNVLMQAGRTPKIADFGLAKTLYSDSQRTRTGEVLGTPSYMAPEQASGVVKTLTPACDIYALGAITYRLLTGRPPFAAAEPLQTVMQVLSEDPVSLRRLNPEIPRDLETICLKCLSKTPQRRYDSARELKADLERFLEGRAIMARPVSRWERGAKWIRRNPVVSVLIACVVVLVTAALIAQSVYNAALADQLGRTRRLADHGSDLSEWLINEHLAKLNRVAGTSVERHALVSEVQRYLDASLSDMPPDAKYIWRLGQSYARLAAISGGSDLSNLGMPAVAKKNYEKSLELYDRAEAQGGQVPIVARLRTASLLELALVCRALQEQKRYQELLRRAEEQLQRLDMNQDPDAQLMNVRLRLARAEDLMAANDHEKALGQLDEVRPLFPSEASSDPRKTTHFQILLASNRGECYEYLGALEDAEQAYQRAARLAAADSQRHPTDVLATRRYASTLTQWGDILSVQEQTAKALEKFIESRRLVEKLYELDPGNAELAAEVAVKCSRVSGAHRYLNQLDQADEAIMSAIAIDEQLAENSIPRRRALAVDLLAKADICIAKGDSQTASEYLQRHRSVCREILGSEPDSVTELNQLAENHFLSAVQLVPQLSADDFEPGLGRENRVFQQIDAELASSLRMFERISKLTSGLNYHQEQYQEKVQMTRDLIQNSVDQQQQASRSNE